MITKPSIFEQDYMRSGAVNHTIVELTDGSTTWYLSEVEMQFGTTHVYGLLDNHSGIREALDIFSKKWSVSNVTVQLINSAKILSSGSFKKPSDVLTGIRGNTAKIYLLAGSQTTSITSDCLLRFTGIVSGETEYTNDRVRIELISKEKSINKILPENCIGDIYTSELLPINETKKIPIVYGKYNSITDSAAFDPREADGLAMAVRKSRFMGGSYVVSDHQCDALSTNEIYQLLSGLSIPANYDSSGITVTLNDSGRTTVTISFNNNTYAYFLMDDGSDKDPDDIYFDGTCINYENTIDGSDSTYGQIQDEYDVGVGAGVAGGAHFYISDIDFLLNGIPDDSSDVRPDEVITDVKVQYKIVDDITIDDFTRIEFYLDGAILSPQVYFSYTSSATRQTSADQISNLYGVNIDALVVKVQDSNAGDGITDNLNMTKVYDLRLRCSMTRKSFWDMEKVFVAADGLAYGSWIDSRSSNYSSGDCIEDPAGIIESILRDWLSLSSSDIDLTTFINAENTSVTARINLHSENEMDALKVIRQIAEQSTFAYHWTAAGKARLIPLNNNSPTTNKTFFFSDIVNGAIKIRKSPFLVNELNLSSRYQQEFGNKYRDQNTYSNSTSQSSYGTKTFNSKWPNICGTAAAHVANHLIRKADGSATDGDGIWANEHIEIEFMAQGFKAADLEIGDWIELDDTSVDPQLLCYGSSWSGKQFLVIELQQYLNTTRIKALEVF